MKAQVLTYECNFGLGSFLWGRGGERTNSAYGLKIVVDLRIRSENGN